MVPTLSYKASEPKLLSEGFGTEGSVQSTDFGCPADGTFFREHAVFKAANRGTPKSSNKLTKPTIFWG